MKTTAIESSVSVAQINRVLVYQDRAICIGGKRSAETNIL